MKVVIVGGCGFLGTALAKHMSSQEHQITVLDCQGSSDVAPYFSFDLLKQNPFKFVDNADLVVNCAIVQVPQINGDPWLGYAVNVRGLQKLLDAVEQSRCGGLVHVSSWEVQETVCEERSQFYRQTKVIQEKLVEWFRLAGKKRYGVVRIGTLLGEGMNPDTAASIFIEKALKGEAVTPYSHSLMRQLHYLDILDAQRLITQYCVDLMDDKAPELATFYHPMPVSIWDLAQSVHCLTGCEVQVVSPKVGGNPSYTNPVQTLARVIEARKLKP